MAIIRIKDLLVRTYIGFNPDEVKNKQDVIINMTIHVDVSGAVEKDQIDGAYNYKSITKSVFHMVQDGHFSLLETLTQRILDLIMSDNNVKYAKVEVDKPHALRFAQSVSVELEQSR